MKYFFVGSTNPVKVAAVKLAVADHWPQAEVIGYEVESGVAAQPRSDLETQAGAVQRAKLALAAGQQQYPEVSPTQTLGVGLEGGVTPWNGAVWSTVWAAVASTEGQIFTANGARIQLDPLLERPIMAGGEMGPVVAQLTGVSDVRKKQGMIGIVTRNFVTRTSEYGSIAKLAVGLWYGRDWAAPLRSPVK